MRNQSRKIGSAVLLATLAISITTNAADVGVTSAGPLSADAALRFKRIEPVLKNFGYPLMSSLWIVTDASPFLYVCWESVPADSADQRQWVRAAVETSWEKHSALQFRGWQQCSPTNKGIHIQIDDSGPRTLGLGRQIDTLQNGMLLNFTFNNWSPACKSTPQQYKACITSIAVHEFGHAIGFAHEQNRPDTPGECTLRQGTSGDKLLTPYDPHSVMNYCNPIYNNNGELSALDIEALQYLYGAPGDIEQRRTP